MRASFGEKFDVPDGYCNTASIGIPPQSVAEAVHAAVDDWAAGRRAPADFDPLVAQARAAFAGLIGVRQDTVAIGTSVSQLIAPIAASLPTGARVLVRAGEFTSVTFPFAARDLSVTEVPAERLVSEVDGHDLVAVSLVQSADGALLDLETLRAEVERCGARLLLDVTQACGWMPLQLDWVDYVVCAGYKWLMCPRGAAWLAVREPHELTPVHANWYAGENPWATVYDLPLRLAGDARRLDLSPVWLSQVGAGAVLRWLAGLDLGAVAAHNIGLANELRSGLGMTPANSAIVSANVGDKAELLAAAGVRASARAGRTRFAFHLYNTSADVELVLRTLGAS